MLETCNQLFNWRGVLAMLAAGLVLLVARPAAADNPVPLSRLSGRFPDPVWALAGDPSAFPAMAWPPGLSGERPQHHAPRPIRRFEIVTDQVILTAATVQTHQ